MKVISLILPVCVLVVSGSLFAEGKIGQTLPDDVKDWARVMNDKKKLSGDDESERVPNRDIHNGLDKCGKNKSICMKQDPHNTMK